jgi:hypothetical protein
VLLVKALEAVRIRVKHWGFMIHSLTCIDIGIAAVLICCAVVVVDFGNST